MLLEGLGAVLVQKGVDVRCHWIVKRPNDAFLHELKQSKTNTRHTRTHRGKTAENKSRRLPHRKVCRSPKPATNLENKRGGEHFRDAAPDIKIIRISRARRRADPKPSVCEPATSFQSKWSTKRCCCARTEWQKPRQNARQCSGNLLQ